MKSETTLTTLRDALRRFADERDWNQYHSPKNLAISVALEASELLEHFQWSDEVEPKEKEAIGHEMADVLLYLVRLADRLDIEHREHPRERRCQRRPPYGAAPTVSVTSSW